MFFVFALLLQNIFATACLQYNSSVFLNTNFTTPLDQLRLVGYFCENKSHKNNPLLLTVHGLTYNHNYFDFSYNNMEYSFVDYAVKKKYAVFNIDRIGVGASGHPDGSLVNLDASVATIHQLIMQLRNGSLIGTSFDNIVYIGHSYGSIIGVRLAAIYPNDVDGLILSGYMHNLNPYAFSAGGVIPVQYDPKFGLNAPLNYLTLTQNASSEVFFYPGNVNVGVVAENYAQRDMFSSTVFIDVPVSVGSTESLSITKPVQIIVGEHDAIFCGFAADCTNSATAYAHESPYFSSAADLEVVVVPDTGHCLNLHENHKATYKDMTKWISKISR